MAIEATLEDELAVWGAERAITRVIQRYARSVDARDFEAVRACFHPDAQIHYGDFYRGGLDEALDFLAASLPALESTLHVFGTPWIELDLAAGEARVERWAVDAERKRGPLHGSLRAARWILGHRGTAERAGLGAQSCGRGRARSSGRGSGTDSRRISFRPVTRALRTG